MNYYFNDPSPLVFGAITATKPYSSCGQKIALGELYVRPWGRTKFYILSALRDGKYNLRVSSVPNTVVTGGWQLLFYVLVGGITYALYAIFLLYPSHAIFCPQKLQR